MHLHTGTGGSFDDDESDRDRPRWRRLWWDSPPAGAAAPPPPPTSASPATSILLGNTIAQSGPAAAYGTIANAENAYFTYVNNTDGGVNGRKINFKILDDGYNPAQTVPLTKQLVEQDQVFAMFERPRHPDADLGARLPQRARRCRSSSSRPARPPSWPTIAAHPYTIGWQPPYQGEARIYAKDVIANHPSAKIGVLYQNDDYGQDYLKGLTDGLGSNASLIVDKEPYDVTAADTLSQLLKLKASGADTVFLFTTPAFTIKSLVIITKLGWEPTIYLNSVSNPRSTWASPPRTARR